MVKMQYLSWVLHHKISISECKIRKINCCKILEFLFLWYFTLKICKKFTPIWINQTANSANPVALAHSQALLSKSHFESSIPWIAQTDIKGWKTFWSLFLWLRFHDFYSITFIDSLESDYIQALSDNDNYFQLVLLKTTIFFSTQIFYRINTRVISFRNPLWKIPTLLKWSYQ